VIERDDWADALVDPTAFSRTSWSSSAELESYNAFSFVTFAAFFATALFAQTLHRGLARETGSPDMDLARAWLLLDLSLQ
jgi:hypothetical protein